LTNKAWAEESTTENAIKRQNSISINLKSLSYISYSTIKPSYPFKIGYPSFDSNAMGFDLNFQFSPKQLQHNISINAIFPSRITSNNGTGNNYLINENESSYNRYESKYYFFDKLWSFYNIELLYGFSSSVLYENRILHFLSSDIIEQEDINFGIGPVLGIEWNFWKLFTFNAEGHYLVFLPYTCYGRYSYESALLENRKDNYFPVTYKSVWDLSINSRINNKLFINTGYRNTSQIGYGNSKNSIIMSNIITSKMDKLNEIYLGIVLGF
jgi:hypothetical protein